jgi:hypothetical protein
VRDEFDLAAHVMLILKLDQLSQRNLRGLYLREELRASWSRYHQVVRDEPSSCWCNRGDDLVSTAGSWIGLLLSQRRGVSRADVRVRTDKGSQRS